MRFSRPIAQAVVLLISAGYVLYLASQSQLNLYIHPRYIVFTTTMAVLGLIATVLNGHFAAKETKASEYIQLNWLYLPLLFLLGSALLLPAQTLSSATVSQRTIDSGSIVSTTQSRSASALFAGSSKGLSVSDWSRLLLTNEDPAYYNNKPAKISGFIYDADLGGDTVWIARFILTCCAVDAQPVGVPIQIKDWEREFREDTWIEAEGEFKLTETAQGEQMVLIPTSVTQIDEPKNPYGN